MKKNILRIIIVIMYSWLNVLCASDSFAQNGCLGSWVSESFLNETDFSDAVELPAYLEIRNRKNPQRLIVLKGKKNPKALNFVQMSYELFIRANGAEKKIDNASIMMVESRRAVESWDIHVNTEKDFSYFSEGIGQSIVVAFAKYAKSRGKIFKVSTDNVGPINMRYKYVSSEMMCSWDGYGFDEDERISSLFDIVSLVGEIRLEMMLEGKVWVGRYTYEKDENVFSYIKGSAQCFSVAGRVLHGDSAISAEDLMVNKSPYWKDDRIVVDASVKYQVFLPVRIDMKVESENIFVFVTGVKESQENAGLANDIFDAQSLISA